MERRNTNDMLRDTIPDNKNDRLDFSEGKSIRPEHVSLNVSPEHHQHNDRKNRGNQSPEEKQKPSIRNQSVATKAFAQEIFAAGLFKASDQVMADYSKDFAPSLAKTQVVNYRWIGTIIGIIIFGVIGKFVWDSVISIILGCLIGLVLGRYIGMKATAVKKHKGYLTEFYLLECKLKALLLWLADRKETDKGNLNSLRVAVEIVFQESKCALLYNEPPEVNMKKLKKHLESMATKFKSDPVLIDALRLTYKLTKIYYLEHIKDKNPDPVTKKRFVNKVRDVLFTFKRISDIYPMEPHLSNFSYSSVKPRKSGPDGVKEPLTFKIRRFLELPEIAEMMEQQPDILANQQVKEIFLTFLSKRFMLSCPVQDLVLPSHQPSQDGAPPPPQLGRQSSQVLPPGHESHIIHPFGYKPIVYNNEDINFVKELSLLPGDLTMMQRAGSFASHSEVPGEPSDAVANRMNDYRIDNTTGGYQIQDLLPAAIRRNPTHQLFPNDEDDDHEGNDGPGNNDDNQLQDIYNIAGPNSPDQPPSSPIQNENLIGEDSQRNPDENKPLSPMKKHHHSPTHKVAANVHKIEEMKVVEGLPLRHFEEAVASPKRHPHIKPEVLEYFKRLQEIQAEDVKAWETVHENEYMRIYKTQVPESPVLLIKSYATIAGIPPEKVFRAISDVKIRTSWDSVFREFRIIEKLNENQEVLYSQIKAPFGISDRDFLQLKSFAHGYPFEGSHILHFKSMTHPAMPPNRSHIRAETLISGYIMDRSKNDPNTTELTIVAQTDIKGYIPTSLVNVFAARAPKEWINNLIRACNKM